MLIIKWLESLYKKGEVLTTVMEIKTGNRAKTNIVKIEIMTKTDKEENSDNRHSKRIKFEI